MPPCHICGDNTGLAYTCNECGGKYCSDHRLPEAHRCDALAFTISKKNTDRSNDETNIPDGNDHSESGDTGWEIRPGYREPKNKTGHDRSAGSGYSPKSTHPASPEHQPGGGLSYGGRRHGKQATNNLASNSGGSSAITTLFSYLLAPFVLLWGLKKPLLLVGVLILGASLAPGIPPDSFLSPSNTAAIANATAGIVSGPTTATATASGGTAADTQTSTDTATTTADTSVSEAEIEATIHARVNEIRESQGLSPLQIESSFTTAARSHSEEMAERGELYHGDTRARYGSQCPAIGENVAQTYADGTILTDSGTVDYDYNETRIGKGIVRQWMDSPGHRDNILSSKWHAEGIGVYVTESDDGKLIIYATQGFCGE